MHMSSPDAPEIHALIDLPLDVLNLVFSHAADARTLCSLGCACKQTASAAASDALWEVAARSAGVGKPWRASLRALHLANAALRSRFALKPPPASAPRKLRCSPASACCTIAPFSHTERTWLEYCNRVQEGTLHLESSSRLLHLHDASDACVGVAVLADGPDDGTAAAPSLPLLDAVGEFRYRVQLARRVAVIDASAPAGQRASAALGQLPPGFCQRRPAAPAAQADAPPAVVVADVPGGKLSIGRAMDLVGLLVHERLAYDSGEHSAPTRLHWLVLAAASAQAADTLERAARSIVFKSSLALPTT